MTKGTTTMSLLQRLQSAAETKCGLGSDRIVGRNDLLEVVMLLREAKALLDTRWDDGDNTDTVESATPGWWKRATEVCKRIGALAEEER